MLIRPTEVNYIYISLLIHYISYLYGLHNNNNNYSYDNIDDGDKNNNNDKIKIININII